MASNKYKRLQREMRRAMEEDSKGARESVWMEVRQHLATKERAKFERWIVEEYGDDSD